MTGEHAAHRPLIVLLGPTASGKTQLAIALAQAINGEIVGADSRQVYRYMDIGTAKPTPEERAQAAHHLVDFLDPADTLSLARYQEMAYAAIDDIHARGRVPLLVGGTGQYITGVIEGWTVPRVPPNETLRAELEDFAQTHGPQALYDRLQQLDPDAATKIHSNNTRRVIRALEVCMESGERISTLQQKKPPPYTLMEHGLTLERQTLYDRADLRVDRMMETGFLGEVRHLLDMGYDRALPALGSLGYQQLAQHLLDGVSLDEAILATKTATHNFIRRQLSWFRGHDSGIMWHNVQQDITESFVVTVLKQLNDQ